MFFIVCKLHSFTEHLRFTNLLTFSPKAPLFIAGTVIRVDLASVVCSFCRVFDGFLFKV